MKPLWDRHRGEGRTRRMMQTAVAKMLAGCSVYVVVRDAQVGPIMDMLAFLAPAAESRNKREVFQGSGFIRLVMLGSTIRPQDLWREGRFHGAGDRAVVLVDHHVIEQELGFALNQWLLWCGPELGVEP